MTDSTASLPPPLPDKPLPDKPLPDKPLPDKPLPDKPLPGGPMPGGPMPGGPMPGGPMPDGPMPGGLDQAFAGLLEPIRASLLRIEGRWPDSRHNGEQHDRPPQDLPRRVAGEPSHAELLGRLETLQTTLAGFWERITMLLDVAPPAEEQLDSPAADDAPPPTDPWIAVLLGEELATSPTWKRTRREFLHDTLAGDPAARNLAGHLLIVRAAGQEELPELLRPVGEAYYRWRPRSASLAEDPFEQTLAQWLNQLAERAGLPNSIQLVRPGERFDSTRHIAAGRGVEIVAVHGWVVLRDRTKVYTRANVTVR